jgi:hypothetical protein
MAAPSRDVQMIRLPAVTDASGPEQAAGGLEALVHRDVHAVFPNAAAKRAAAAAAANDNAAERLPGRFVSGETVILGDDERAPEDGAAQEQDGAPPYTSKSLAEQLQERKEAREQEKDAARRELERPGGRLDADEVEFLERVREAEEGAERRRLAEEASGVADFRRAVEEEAARKRRRREEEEEGEAAATATAAAAGATTRASGGAEGPSKATKKGPRLPGLVVIGPAGRKKQKAPEEPQEDAPAAPPAAPVAGAPPPLGGLLGDYGSSSSEDEGDG